MKKQTVFNVVVGGLLLISLIAIVDLMSDHNDLQQQVLIMSGQNKQIVEAIEENVAIDQSQQDNLEDIATALDEIVNFLE